MGFTTLHHAPGAWIFRALALCALLTAAPARAAEPALGLEAAVALAIENNPGLAAAASRAEAAATRPAQVGALPDPSIAFRAMNLPVDSFDTTQENMTQLQLGLSQRLPFPGKLALRAESAELEARARRSEALEARLILVRNVKTAWWTLAYLDRATATLHRTEELMRNLIEIARTKYKVGQGLQQDVLLAQVELSKLLDADIGLIGQREREAARFNALLDRPVAMAVTLPAEISRELSDVPGEPELIEMARAARPLLASGRKRLDAAQASHRLAERDLFPDFSLNAGYGFRGGNNPNGRARADFLSLGLGMTIPLYAGSKQKRAIRQRKIEISFHRQRLRELTSRVDAEVSAAHAAYRQARRQAELLLTGLIPQAAQTVDAMRAGYLVNKVDFLNLVRAQTTLNEYDTRYWRAVSDANKALAALAAASGKETIHE